MQPSEQPELVDVILIEFGYYQTGQDGIGEGRAFVWLPADLLWSSQGLAQMFEITRIAFLGADGAESDEEAWQTWHLVTIHKDTDTGDIDNRVVVNVDWPKAVPKRPAGKD